MPNKILTEAEFIDDVTKAFADTKEIYGYVSNECFERMKKYMTQESIIKAIELRNKILLDSDGKQ